MLKKLLGLVFVLALIAAACGDDDDAATAAGSDSADEAMEESADEAMEDMDDEAMEDGEMEEMAEGDMEDMEDMDHEGMAMGSPDAIPAGEIDGAELATGSLELLPTAPEDHQGVDGTVAIARSDIGTTVTVEATGLVPGTEYISHVHAGSCDENGGPHYKFDPAGSDAPPNEIHLGFAADANGAITWTASNDQTAGDDARTWVVHLADDPSVYIACGTFG